MSRTKEARTFALDTLIVAVTQGVQKLRALATLPLIVKLLGSESYGIWSQTLTFVSVASAMFLFNLHLPLVRMVAADTSGKMGRIYSSILLAQWAIYAALAIPFVVFGGPLSTLVMGRPGLERFVLIGLLLILFGNIRMLNNNLYRATGRFGIRSIVDLLSTFGGLGIIFFLLLRSSSLMMVMMALVIWETVCAIVTTAHCLIIAGIARPDRSIMKEAFIYCLPLLPSGLAITLLDRADRFFISNGMGLKIVGVYSATYALATAILLFEAPFQFTLFPKISALWDRDRALAGKYLSLSIHIFLILAIPCVVAIPILAPRFLSIMGNAETGSAGTTTILFLCLGVLFWGVALCESVIFYASRHTGAMAKIIVTGALLNVAMNAILVPLTGLVGAALATFISYALVCVWMNRVGRRDLPLTWQGGLLVKSVIASLMAGVVLYLWAPQRVRTLIAATICGAVTYIVVLVGTRAITPEHLAKARTLFRRQSPG